MQDEFGNSNSNNNNNFDPHGSPLKQNLDFHLDTTWEFSSVHDISHGLFRVNARNINSLNIHVLKSIGVLDLSALFLT